MPPTIQWSDLKVCAVLSDPTAPATLVLQIVDVSGLAHYGAIGRKRLIEIVGDRFAWQRMQSPTPVRALGNPLENATFIAGITDAGDPKVLQLQMVDGSGVTYRAAIGTREFGELLGHELALTRANEVTATQATEVAKTA